MPNQHQNALLDMQYFKNRISGDLSAIPPQQWQVEAFAEIVARKVFDALKTVKEAREEAYQ